MLIVSGQRGLSYSTPLKRRAIIKVREVKAYVCRNRIRDVVNALYKEGFKNLTVIDVEGLPKALDGHEQRHSVEIGQQVVTEVKLELFCENENRTAEAVALIRTHAKTGQPAAGWIYITEIGSCIEITD